MACLAGLRRCLPCLPAPEVTVTSVVREAIIGRLPSNKALFSMSTLLLNRDPSRQFSKHYKKGPRIGTGGFGTVYKCRHLLTGDERAVKIVAKSKINDDLQYVFTEVEVLLRLDHPHLAKLHEFFEQQGDILLVVELCSCGDFGTLHKSGLQAGLEAVRPLFRDVVHALGYIHGQGVVHRDLKFENCLLCQGRARKIAKVIDFGLSAIKRFSGTPKENEVWLNEPLGTKYFAAPEVIDPSQKYGVKCDLWSVGVMLYILFTNQHPFAEDASEIDTRTLFKRILTGPYRTDPLLKVNAPSSACELMAKLMTKEQNLRIDAKGALEMEWLRPSSSNEMDISKALSRVSSEKLGRRLDSFSQTSHFDKVLLMLVAHQAQLKEVEEMRMAFLAMDKNGDGTVSRQELELGLRALGQVVNPETFGEVFAWLDSNGNSTLDYSEWLCATMEPRQIATEESMKDLFDFFDTDATGSISRQELTAVLKDEDEARNVIDKYDASKDGFIDYEEFKRVMQELAQMRSIDGG